mgnify:CR=1 FL=1
MQSVSIADYGAKEGALCTEAIQRALDAASAAGGVAVIPRGTYRTGTLNLRGASLCLEKGAVLKGSADFADYPEIGYDHNEMGQVRSLLYVMDEQDVHIYGEGTIDLSAEAFYGVRITGAPCWTMSFVECEDVREQDLTIDNDRRIPNNDGMHFCSCKGVIVRGCNISAGDDCIAISCITNWDKPCEDVVIADCILRSSSKAIVVGYMHSIVRNVNISNCVILDSNRSLCIMSSTDGIVENVTASNLRLDTRCRAGNWWGNGEPIFMMAVKHDYLIPAEQDPHRETDCAIRNVHIDGVTCMGENAMGIYGVDGNIREVELRNIDFTRKPSKNLPLKGNVFDFAPGRVDFEVPEDCGLYIGGGADVKLENINTRAWKIIHA